MKTLRAIIKKDLKLMQASRLFWMMIGSLIVYSAYINLIYVNLDQASDPVYLYNPEQVQLAQVQEVAVLDSLEQMHVLLADKAGVGIDMSQDKPVVKLAASGSPQRDNLRIHYAWSLLKTDSLAETEIIGQFNKDMKNRREITSEFLFFELTAVGFLGIAGLQYKEKQMGVLRLQSVLPVDRKWFVLTRLGLCVIADLVFAGLLTLLNLGLSAGWSVMSDVIIQTVLLSLIMTQLGFCLALYLPDFKQFSLLYFLLVITITTPIFIHAQTGINLSWIRFHPMYHLFRSLKAAFFGETFVMTGYYVIVGLVIAALYKLTNYLLAREMIKEG